MDNTEKRTLSLKQLMDKASNAKLEQNRRVNVMKTLKKHENKKSLRQIANENKNKIENFTGSGKLLGDTDRALYQNKFINTSASKTIPYDEKERFRKYYENVLVKEDTSKKMRHFDTNDPMSTNPIDRENKRRSNGKDRYNKPRLSILTIDSKDRNVIDYPNSNEFKMDLRRQYRNVKSVRLVSTEFPNTDQVIKKSPLDQQNNRVYWINDEDADEDYSCLIYNADILPGNYSSIVLNDELEEQIATINRFSDNTPHEFLISIDPNTDIAEFQSIQSTQLSVNPLSTTEGSNLIVVNHPSHNFSIGNQAVITGARSVGGISSIIINDTHIVTGTTINTYNIRVSSISSTTKLGGGSNVKSGINKPFKLLFSNIDTIGEILGFPQQDSSFHITTEISEIDISPENLETGIEYGTGTVPARFKTSSSHKLTIGDEIYIQNTDTIPAINGEQIVTKVISETEFEIGKIIKIINNQSVFANTELGLVIESLDDDFTDGNITFFSNSKLETQNPHGLLVDDVVYIDNLTSTPDINGIQTVTEIINTNEFNIDTIITNGDSIAPQSESDGVYVIPTNTPIQLTNFIYQNTGLVYTLVNISLDPERIWIFNSDTNNIPNVNGNVSGVLETPKIGLSNNMEIKLPNSFSITSTDIGSPVTVNVTGHSFVNGEIVTISGHSGTVPNINGSYTISNVVAGVSFDISVINTTVAGGATGIVTGNVDTTSFVDTIFSQLGSQQMIVVDTGDNAFTISRVIRENRGMLGSINHKLSDNELIFIAETDTTPDINDINIVTIVDGDYIETDSTITSVNSITNDERYVHTTDISSTDIRGIYSENEGLFSTGEVLNELGASDVVFNLNTATKTPADANGFQTVGIDFNSRTFDSSTVTIIDSDYDITSTSGNPTIITFGVGSVPIEFEIGKLVVIRGTDVINLNGSFTITDISSTQPQISIDVNTSVNATVGNIHQPGRYFRTFRKTGTEGTNSSSFGRIRLTTLISRIENNTNNIGGDPNIMRLDGTDIISATGGQIVLVNGTGTTVDGLYFTTISGNGTNSTIDIDVSAITPPADGVITTGTINNQTIEKITDLGGVEIQIDTYSEHFYNTGDELYFTQYTGVNGLNGSPTSNTFIVTDVFSPTSFSVNLNGLSELAGTFVGLHQRIGVTIIRTSNKHNLIPGDKIYMRNINVGEYDILSSTIGSPCTVTTVSDHNFVTGQTIKIKDHDQRNLEGKHIITGITSNTFTFTPTYPSTVVGGNVGEVLLMTYPDDLDDNILSVNSVIDTKTLRIVKNISQSPNNMSFDGNERVWMYTTFDDVKDYTSIYTESNNFIETLNPHGMQQNTNPNIFIVNTNTVPDINNVVQLGINVIDSKFLELSGITIMSVGSASDQKFVSTLDTNYTSLSSALGSIETITKDVEFGIIEVVDTTTYTQGDVILLQDTLSSPIDNSIHTINNVISGDTFQPNNVINSVFTVSITNTTIPSTITITDATGLEVGDSITIYNNLTNTANLNGTHFIDNISGNDLTISNAIVDFTGVSNGTLLINTKGLAIRSRDSSAYDVTRIINGGYLGSGIDGFYQSNGSHGMSSSENIYINTGTGPFQGITTGTPLEIGSSGPIISTTEFTISDSIGTNATLEINISDEFVKTSTSPSPLQLTAHKQLQGGIEYIGTDVWNIGDQVYNVPYETTSESISGAHIVSFVDTDKNLLEFTNVTVNSSDLFIISTTTNGNPTIIFSENHTFQTGNSVVISGNSIPAINGTHIISDVIAGLSFTIPVVTNFSGNGGTVEIDSVNNVQFFKTPVNAFVDNINTIGTTFPTVITANGHGIDIGSTIVYVQDTSTTPVINGFHDPATVIDTNNIGLDGIGPVVTNNSIIRINRPASLSKQSVESNAGFINEMIAGTPTTIVTNTRQNTNQNISFTVSRSEIGNPGTVYASGHTFSTGDIVTINGQQGGDEYLEGQYTINSIISDVTVPISTVTIGSPTIITTTIPHGFVQNDYVIFDSISSTITPLLNDKFLITNIPSPTEIEINISSALAYDITTSEVSVNGTVNAPGHTFSISDIITIVGHANSTPDINGSFTITSIVAGVSFDIGVQITISGSGGVVFGPSNIPFVTTGNATSGGGFTLSGTNVTTAGVFGMVTGPSESISGHGLRSATGTIISNSIGQPTIITTMSTSELVSGRTVLINGSDSTPSINGEFEIEVLSSTTFQINDVNVTIAGTTGTWEYGDTVVIRDIKTDPDITNTPYRVTVIDDTTFTIPVETTYIDQTQILTPDNCYGREPPSWGSDKLIIELCDHGLQTNDVIFLYNVEQLGLIPSQNINTVHGDKRNNQLTRDERVTRKYIRVVDSNYFEICTKSLLSGNENILRGFPYQRNLGGGFFVCISANNHTTFEKSLGFKNYGFNAIQTNENCNQLLNRVISLEGDEYVFLISDQLQAIVNSNDDVENAFAKIMLTGQPGSVLFDTFVTNTKNFEDPFRVIDDINIKVLRPNGKPFQFNGANFSFTLEIKEYVDRLRHANLSTQRNAVDRGLISQYGNFEDSEQENNNYFLNNNNTEDGNNVIGIAQLLQENDINR